MAKFEMDTEFIRKLAKLLEETNLGEIEMADGERRIRVARPAVAPLGAVAMPPPPMAGRAPMRGRCAPRRRQPTISASIPAR